MNQAQLEIFACDEETYVENINYIQLSGMSKGFLIDSGSLRPEVRDCQLNFPEKDSCALEPSMCFHKKCWENGGLLTQCQNLNENELKVCVSVSKFRDPALQRKFFFPKKFSSVDIPCNYNSNKD